MTLIEMEGFLRGKCIPRDILVNESNAQYLLRKLTELQKDNETLRAMMREVEIQRNALVAESASMKHAISEINDSAEEVEHDGYLTFVINPDCLYCAVDLIEDDTPATDAAIAEIGAKAIRDCAESLLANDDIGIEHEYPLMLSYANKLRGGGV
ncbi:hypothetical protein R9X49_06385 [Pectobacterium carotovorum]|uniref:hypothetical protein n=1 Tax=Pectobacterium carotovorum TaxID=554 RepID=UPI0029D56F5D|nr:hypothetical protein [Pectobacterium carotovorum]MDX6914733.1 hypothetical protein [Pectobacterium carotovorum]